jgi:hypothetical protein
LLQRILRHAFVLKEYVSLPAWTPRLLIKNFVRLYSAG